MPLLVLSACQGSEKVERLHSRPGKEMSGGEISGRVSLLFVLRFSANTKDDTGTLVVS